MHPSWGGFGSIVTIAERRLLSTLIFLEHHKLNIPTADGGELTLPTHKGSPEQVPEPVK